MELCRYGRGLSRLEDIFRSYYAQIAHMRTVEKDKKMRTAPYVYHDGKRSRNVTYSTALRIMLKHQEKWICEMFLDAVNRNDAVKILKIAEAYDFSRITGTHSTGMPTLIGIGFYG